MVKLLITNGAVSHWQWNSNGMDGYVILQSMLAWTLSTKFIYMRFSGRVGNRFLELITTWLHDKFSNSILHFDQAYKAYYFKNLNIYSNV